ncbi:MAG: hypothetical protein K6F69_11250 [Treponema sp.]|nr:hypothetical protein [Treponema sp.]
MKHGTEIALKTIAAALLIFAFSLIGNYIARFLFCFPAADRIPYIQNYSIMKFIVYGTSRNSVSARFWIYDNYGREIAVIDRSWNGESLNIDFVSAEFRDKKVLFPFRIYPHRYRSTIPVLIHYKSGTHLYPYYLEDKQCLLMSYIQGIQARKDLYTLARFALRQSTKVFGNYAKLYTLNLSGAQSGIYYSIYTSYDGSLYFKQD